MNFGEARSSGELVDWLGGGSPSLLDQAVYLDTETSEVMDILGWITEQKIHQTRIGPEPYVP